MDLVVVALVGGGGAGGVRFYPRLPVSAGEYTITVGQGGNGAANYDNPGTVGAIQLIW